MKNIVGIIGLIVSLTLNGFGANFGDLNRSSQVNTIAEADAKYPFIEGSTNYGPISKGISLEALSRQPVADFIDPVRVSVVHKTKEIFPPSPYSPDTDNVHPDVIIFDEPWQGYRYWMVWTPYPNTDAAFENPSIAVSHDGYNWDTPVGLVNPVVERPDWPGAYNSDPELTFDNGKLWITYRRKLSGEDSIWTTSSTNGVDWIPEYEVLAGSTTTWRQVSPTIAKVNGEWRMWAHDITTSNIYYSVCENMGDQWQFNTNQVCDLKGWPTTLWHLKVRNVGGQLLLMGSTEWNSGGDLVLIKSEDGGITWDWKTHKIVMTDYFGEVMYRSTFYPVYENGQPKLKIWWGTIGWTFGIGECYYLDGQNHNKNLISDFYAIDSQFMDGDADNFNRTDSGTLGSLSTSPSSRTWIQESGGFGVTNNQACSISAGNNRAYFDSGIQNNYIELTISELVDTSPQQIWLVSQFTDGSNYLRFGHNTGSSWFLQEVNGGAVTILDSIDSSRIGRCAVGDVISLRVDSSGFAQGMYNDEVILSGTYTNGLTSKVGLQMNSTEIKVDNFLCKEIE